MSHELHASAEEKTLLSCDGVSVHFPVKTGLFGKESLRAVESVSVSIRAGEVLGLVGESGCGKSTLARLLVGLEKPTSGSVLFRDRDLWNVSAEERRRIVAREVAMVFQDPSSSLNPRMRVRDLIQDPLDIHEVEDRRQRRERVDELLDLVGLSQSAADRLPRQLSGGQRQRVAVARALALDPSVLVADEPTSALDVSVQAQILNLLVDLGQRLNLAMVFISHDIRAVEHVSNRIAVMYLGRIVEEGVAEDIGASPRHPYTKALFSATPSLSGTSTERIVLEGPVPSPRNPPSGCPFRTRCWKATDTCAEEFPERAKENGHAYFCHHPLEESASPAHHA